jgi:CRP-like cAMP-binding protein
VVARLPLQTGEGCFLGQTVDQDQDSFRYTSNVTAMTDSDLCFLRRQDLETLKEDFPSIQTTLQTVQDERDTTERPRRMFSSAAHGDGTLDKKDMRKLLQGEMFFADDTKELEALIKTIMSAMDVSPAHFMPVQSSLLALVDHSHVMIL